MRALGLAIVRGLVKGLVIGLALGLLLTYALAWPMPQGSLLGYLAAMGAAGTTGIAGGHAPWREGAWLVAALKCVAGVGVGALLYWALCTHLDAALPAEIALALAVPGAGEEGLSWIAAPALSLPALSATFGLLVEIDHVGDHDGDAERPKEKTAGRAAPERASMEQADTELDARPTKTRPERPSR